MVAGPEQDLFERPDRSHVDPVAAGQFEVVGFLAPVPALAGGFVGALRRSMATTGYSDLKEFQRVDVVVSPYAGN